MKELKEILGGMSFGGPGSFMKNVGSLGVVGDKIVDAIGGNKEHKKSKSTMDEAIMHEMERHKEGHKQRMEHGKY